MRIFSKLYSKVIEWSKHRHAPYYLAIVSFVESFILPAPPDVMLISMSLAKPKHSFRYAVFATVGSVLGAILGYLMGKFLFQFIYLYIEQMGYANSYHTVEHWFSAWGILVIFIAGFLPVSYKLFTIGAGAMHVAFIPYVIISLISRGLRFSIVAFSMYWGGERLHHFLHKYIDVVAWLVITLLLFLWLLWALGVITF